MLQYIVNMTSAGHPVLHLYSNDLTPDDDCPQEGVGGGPTEVTLAGYAGVTLTGSSWTTTQVGGTTTARYGVGSPVGVTFTETQGGPVYGYYVTDTTNGMLWIERFSGAPFTLPSGGGDIAIIPQLELT